MRNRLIYMVLMLMFIFSSFNIAAEEICLITDQFWNMMMENEGSRSKVSILKNKIIDSIPFISRNSIRVEGRRIKKLVIEYDLLKNYEYIKKQAADKDFDIIILSPLLSGMANELSEQFPEIFFIAAADIDNATADNLSVFRADYAEAYFRAGEWAASQENEVHAVFYDGSDRFRKAKESFLGGWSSLRESQDLSVTVFSRIEDVTAGFIDQFVDKIEGEKTIAAVFAGSHNESFLNRFDGRSTLLLSEYMKNWSECSYITAGSIEMPVSDYLSVIVKSVSTGTYRDGGVVKAAFFPYESQ